MSPSMTRRELISGAAALAAYAMLPRTGYAATTDPIPANRLPFGGTWEGLVGVEGGIPNRTSQAGSTIQPYTGSGGTISTALNNAASGTYVQLAAGTFNLSSGITIPSNRTLRGAVDSNGAPATTLNFTSDAAIILGSLTWDPTSASQWTSIDVSGGATRGSTTITLAAPPTDITIGHLLWLSCPSNGTIKPETSWTAFLGTRPFTQVVKVTGKSGNNVTFSPAINADYLSGAIQVSFRSASLTTVLAGAENLSLVRNNGTSGNGTHYLRMSGTDSCWFKNVKTYWALGGGTHHCWMNCTYRSEIRHCEMYHTVTSGSSSSNAYCILNVHGSNWLIEDNYFHDIPNVMPMMGSGCGAFAFNYINDLPYPASTSWLSQIVFFHGSHCHYNLFEGNWIADSEMDGGSRNNVFFRERRLGWDATGNKTSNTQCIEALGSPHSQDNLVIAGCVLGKDGYHTQYSGGVEGSTAIFGLNSSDLATALRLGNYNTVNDGIPASEALGSGQGLVASYLHSAKPSWFGGLPWPWCEPTNYTQSNNSRNFPAGYRVANGVDPMPGSGVPPAAPSNLRIVP